MYIITYLTYYLDGRKPFPINHGPTTPEVFLQVYFVNVKVYDAVRLHYVSCS